MRSQKRAKTRPAWHSGNIMGRIVRMETQSRVLPPDQIESRLAALPPKAPKDRAARRKNAARLLDSLPRSTLLALSGVATMAFLVWLGLNSEDYEDLETVLAIPGMYGVVATFGGLAAIVRALWSLRSPVLAAPEDVVKTFYTDLGLPELSPAWVQPKSPDTFDQLWAWVMKAPEKDSVDRAWSCLDAVAQAEFGSVDRFARHWTDRLHEMKRQVLQFAPQAYTSTIFASGPVELEQISERVARFCQDVAAVVYQEIEVTDDSGTDAKKKVVHAVLVWPQSKTLLKRAGRWYLTSGSLDGPRAEASLTQGPAGVERQADVPNADLASIAAGVDRGDQRVADLLALFQEEMAWRRETGIRQARWDRIDDPRIIAALQVLARSDSVESIRLQATEALEAMGVSEPGDGSREKDAVRS